MNLKLPIRGGCFCGQVRYEISAPPHACGICHCESCRRIAGAESVGWAVVDRHAFSVTGEPRRFQSSPGVERTFCGHCGSGLTYRRNTRDAETDATIDVALATLEDPELLPPSKETWCAERLSWNSLNRALEHFPGSSSGQSGQSNAD